MNKLSKYDDTTVRILCESGDTFTGACQWFPPEFGLSEFGVEEEALRIGEYMLFERDIREIELLRREVCIPVRDWPEAKEEIAAWFHERWQVPLETCRENIRDCLGEETGVPQWYVVVRESRIIAGCGVVRNDSHRRKDLAPNVCAFHVDGEYRGQGIGSFLLQYVCEDMAAMGIDTLYHRNDPDGVFRKNGWQLCCVVRGNDGRLSRMYVHHAGKS